MIHFALSSPFSHFYSGFLERSSLSRNVWPVGAQVVPPVGFVTWERNCVAMPTQFDPKKG